MDHSDVNAVSLGMSRRGPALPARLYRHLSIANLGVIYCLIILAVVFAATSDTFATSGNIKSILLYSSVSGIIALALVIPLSAHLFDLSIGYAMSLGNLAVAYVLVNFGWNVWLAILGTLMVGVVIGLFNALIVVGAKIDSFIGTLATGALFATGGTILATKDGIVTQVAGEETRSGVFKALTTSAPLGVPLPFWIMVAVAVVIWVVQKYTVIGRRIYALGFNERGSELVGIRTRRLKTACFVIGGVICALAGLILASRTGSGSAGSGEGYLLTAYAAAFLGSTQFGGRFNAWGTVWAVLLLQTGANGIQNLQGPTWAQDLFVGVVLILALGASSLERAVQARAWIRAKAKAAQQTS